MPSLRTLDENERVVLEARVRRAWAGLRSSDQLNEVQLPTLLQGFGDWRRVVAPISEPMHRSTSVLFRSAGSGEYALVNIPDGPERTHPVDEDVESLLNAARDAVVGEFLDLWRWTLDASPALAQTALALLERSKTMDENTRFLAAMASLVDETYQVVAERKRPNLEPLQVSTRGQVEKLFWEAEAAVQHRVTQWSIQAAERFINNLSDREIAEDTGQLRLEVDHLIEVFIDTQHAFDRTAQDQCPFVWDRRSGEF